jgi:hypothetical protein
MSFLYLQFTYSCNTLASLMLITLVAKKYNFQIYLFKEQNFVKENT